MINNLSPIAAPVPGNTKSIGLGGVAIAIGSFLAPYVAQHFFHASPDTISVISNISAYFQGGGLAGAYFGMPVTVKT